ncbi:cytochrome b [Mangrovicoccus algicola]|uniref:Cytochrome b/b6 domain-containing protein n=1 Tax=Mangrovicoccus algicola TaxID=2771008 RepID=A0A8J7CZX1_9RHOB|nr:cytochrome b/b6 domain-containing protein [Mangrovicoccus algicola]MBE3638578.1 cytochrome b/b6 domain-containing protein [Mangrovicoccus algicola]
MRPIPTRDPARHVPLLRLLHWLSAVLVLATIPAGLVMVQEGLPRPLQDALFLFHKNVGPVILILVVARLTVRATCPVPPLPATLSRPQVLAAEAVHGLLYLCLVVMAVSGIVRVQAGGFPMELWDPLIGGLVPRDEALAAQAKAVHAWMRIPLIALILAHAGAAALHGLVLRDGVFRRIWPPF